MQLHVEISFDKEEALRKTSEFLSTLKKGQFQNIQINPILESNTTTREPSAKDERGYTKVEVFRYSYTVVTFYTEEAPEEHKYDGPNLLSS